MCRYYLFVGGFATEVLRERFLLGETIALDDYDRYVLNKAMWHPGHGRGVQAAERIVVCGARFPGVRGVFDAGLPLSDVDGDVPVLPLCWWIRH